MASSSSSSSSSKNMVEVIFFVVKDSSPSRSCYSATSISFSLSPSFCFLSTVSLPLPERRRHREELLETRKTRIAKTQARREEEESNTLFSRHVVGQAKGILRNGSPLPLRIREPEGLLLRQLRHGSCSRREPRQQGRLIFLFSAPDLFFLSLSASI